MAVSHNGRFVYANNGVAMMQFDLQADDIAASMIEVGRYDGYRTPNNFPTSFSTSLLAPDGLIYTTTPSTKGLHIVHKPWAKGETCDFVQRSIWLPRVNSGSTPNHVNYRLGPVDGSPCDTLGIDNVPLARWRHDAEYHTVAFRDLSDYEPATWSWTFGDGAMSTDTSPVHTYATIGDYEVCLTVSNQYGSDELCKTVRIRDSLSAVEAIEQQTQFMVYPNPVLDHLYIRSSDGLGTVDYVIRDVSGRIHHQGQIALHGYEDASLDLSDLPASVYLLELYKDGWPLLSEKVVVGN